MKKFEERDNNVPLIISSSNTIWLQATVAADVEHPFETYKVNELGEEESRKIAVDLLEVWDEADFHTIYSNVGGRLEAMREVFEKQTRNSCSVQSAIAQAIARKCNRLRQLVSESPQIPRI